MNTTDDIESEVASNLGIQVNPFDIIDGVLQSSDKNLNLQGNNGVVVIPSSVTEIANGVFSDVEGLKEVIIPGSVKKIGANAFSYNSGIEKVTMQEGVENITDSAFLLCSDVTTIKFPSTLERISWSTFEGMTKLETIEISKNNPNYISEDGFVYTSGYSTLIYCIAKNKTITINDKVKSLGSYAFNGLKTVEEVIIPDNVTTINIRVFQGCSNLKKISIGKGTTSINQIAFWGINNFELDISDENNYYSSDDTFLYNKDKTTIVSYLKSNLNVVIPEGVVTIGGNAFYAKYITSVKLPSTLKVIGEAAFIMNNLNEIEIPSSVESNVIN